MISSGRTLSAFSRCHTHFITEMIYKPNRCQQYKKVLPTTYIALSLASTTHLSDMLGTENYKSNNLKCHESNNNKNHKGKVSFNQPQIDARTHLEAEMNFSKSDPDIFGDLKCNKETPIEAIEGDEEDKEEEIYLEHAPTGTQKLSTRQYATIIKDFITEKKVLSCEAVHLKTDTLKMYFITVILIFFFR